MTMTCGGFDVLRAQIYAAARGPSSAFVVLDTPNSAPPTSVTLADAGGLSLAMTVVRGGIDPALLKWSGVLVGGAGGLATVVQGAFYQAQLGDVLGSICSQSGEAQSSTIDPSITSIELDAWTLGRTTASSALDLLADAASAFVGSPVTWRTLSDGTIWMGVETWPAASLPASAEIVEPDPMLGRWVIGAEVAALLPGVALAGVGNVTSVEHYVDEHSVRTWAWTSSNDLASRFRALARASLDVAPGSAQPAINYLAHYPCRIVAISDDGMTVDVQPDDRTIAARKDVPVVVGVPGLSHFVESGAVARLGWDGGDPSRPRCYPEWDSATVTRLVLSASTVYLGGYSGAQFLALANLVNAELTKIATAFSTFVPGTGGASFPDAYTVAGDVSAAQVKGI